MKTTEFGVYVFQKRPMWKVEMLHPKRAVFNVADVTKVFIDEGPNEGIWDVEIHTEYEGITLILRRRFLETWDHIHNPNKICEEITEWVDSATKEALSFLKRISSPEGCL